MFIKNMMMYLQKINLKSLIWGTSYFPISENEEAINTVILLSTSPVCMYHVISGILEVSILGYWFRHRCTYTYVQISSFFLYLSPHFCMITHSFLDIPRLKLHFGHGGMQF